ncbi:MAG: M1 family aminopeptidase [Candidatus Eisenbacteria bacterium]
MKIRVLGALLAIALPAAALGEARIVHHTIRAKIDPESSRLVASDRLTVEGHDSSMLRFLLHRDLKIKTIRLEERDLRWEEKAYDSSRWGEEEGSEGSSYDGTREVAVNLRGPEQGRFELLVEYEGVVLDSLHPPKEAYGRSFMTTSGLIEERGAYLAGSTVWTPTIPGDLFTFRLEALVPSDWESVSQGTLAARYEEGVHRVGRWESKDPMEEIYLVAGPYVFRETEAGGRRFQSYLYEAGDGQELHERYAAATGDLLERYSREIGEYPFPKFALVENFWQTGFGMPSFTLLGTQVIRLPFIIHTSYGHEILHNWWGNGVFVDWERGNWCEGLTAYGADYAFKKERSDAEAAQYRRGELQKYRDYVSANEDFPLVDFRSRSDASTQAVGYSKSTMVFHMLRNFIGEGAFREGLRALFRDRKFQVAGWTDLRAAFEKASGADLEMFFEQWTTRRGAPSLNLESVEATKGWSGKYTVKGVVRQGEPPFHVDAPLVIETGAGKDTLTVYLTGKEMKFEWSGSDLPRAVSVDPEFDLFRRLDRTEIPPALSGTLGADSLLIVLPPEGACAFDGELAVLAEQWGKAPGATVVRGAVPEAFLNRRGVWLLGPTVYTERFLESLPAGSGLDGEDWVTPSGRFPAGGHTAVLTARHPGNPDMTWSLVMPPEGEPVASIGRKIPHYGRYGYLVFEGDTNVDKGEWAVTESPLRVTVEVK